MPVKIVVFLKKIEVDIENTPVIDNILIKQFAFFSCYKLVRELLYIMCIIFKVKTH